MNDDLAAKIYDLPTVTELHDCWFLRVITIDYEPSRTTETWESDGHRYRRVITSHGATVIERGAAGEWLPHTVRR